MEVIDLSLEIPMLQDPSCFPDSFSHSEAEPLSVCDRVGAAGRLSRIIFGCFIVVFLCSPPQKVERILHKSVGENYTNTKELLRTIDFNNFSTIVEDNCEQNTWPGLAW